MAKHASSRLCLLIVLTSVISTAYAVQPGDALLPETTVGFVSIRDVGEAREAFNKTQLGELLQDPSMQPFLLDLRRQMRDKITAGGSQFGMTLEDLQGVVSGEACFARIQPKWNNKDYAGVAIVDVTGREAQAKELLAKIAKDMAAQRSTASTMEIAGVTVTVYSHVTKAGELPRRKTYYALHKDHLIAADHAPELQSILYRVNGTAASKPLNTVEPYTYAMDKCKEDVGEMLPHVTYYVNPFRFQEVSEAARGFPKRKGLEVVEILKKQGFEAIQGLGGYVNFATDDHEIAYRAFVYAPPTKTKPNELRYQLAGDMLNFPNAEGLAPLGWIPRGLAMHMSINWKMQNAFYKSETLVDALAKNPDTFRTVLNNIRDDPQGPGVDLEKDLIANLSERATLMSDNRLPITPKSERIMFAVGVKNAGIVRAAVDRALENDPDAVQRTFGEYKFWEIINDETEEMVDAPTAIFDELDQDGFDELDGPGPGAAPAEKKQGIPNSAVAVANGHLIIATHVDFVEDMLKQLAARQDLKSAADFTEVSNALTKMGAGKDCIRYFVRTDEAYRPTYELTKQGKMPESETMFAKLLNRMLMSDNDAKNGTVREQQVDGAKLPEFQVVRRYLGPGGAFVRTQEKGWYIEGCLLKK